MLAAELGFNDILTTLLTVRGINCQIQDADGFTALLLAAVNKNPTAVTRLCLHDPSTKHIDIQNKFGKSALFMAAETGDLESLATLVSFGANPNAFSKRGLSPLMMATILKKHNTFKFLVGTVDKPVCNLEIVGKNGQTVCCLFILRWCMCVKLLFS